MATKQRTPGQTAISVSLPTDLLKLIDGRSKALGLKRSQYLAALARRDVEERGPLALRETGEYRARPSNARG